MGLAQSRAWTVLQRLALGFTLIAAASAILLLSDWRQRRPGAAALPRATTGEPAALSRAKTWQVFIVRYVDTEHSEEGTRGVLAGLAEAGLKEGSDFTARVQSAQGDVATLNSMMDVAKTANADLVVPICTPALQAALNRFPETPIVYTAVASGVQAGAGRTKDDHRPNVTGIDTLGAFAEMADILVRCMPAARRVGTLFTPGEVNSVLNKEQLRAELQKRDMQLVATPVNAPGEVADAILALNSQGVQVLCQVPDNMCASCFASVISAADRARLPVFSFVSKQPKQGSVLAVARDYFDAGREAGLVAARILRGEAPAGIPFTVVKSARLLVNLRQAARLGVQVPESVLKRADEVLK